MDKKTKEVLDKLRLPIHYTFIANYILKRDEKYTLLFLKELENLGYIKEHSAGGYYVAV
jgi:hypothetical protein